MEDKEIQLEESQLLIDAKSRTIVIKLYEKDGERNLALTGSPELMAAAGMEVAGIELPLIMPHDTMLEIGRALGGVLYKVCIYDLVDGKLRARLHMLTSEGEERTVEMNVSTALALALKGEMFLTTYESVFEKDMDVRQRKIDWFDLDESFVLGMLNSAPDAYYEQCSPDDLKRYLDKAVESEDYMLAARLRELMKKRGTPGREDAEDLKNTDG